MVQKVITYMEEFKKELNPPKSQAEILSPCSSGRRRSSDDSNSPEFEFWNITRNPTSFPQPNLLSADELFADGVLLPLDQLHVSSDEPEMPTPEPDGGADFKSTAAASAPTPSKRWRDIIVFRKNAAKSGVKESISKKVESKKNGGGVGKAAELNINIWPFRRSSSAGNVGPRPRVGGASGFAGRKASSAPCSRSNSGGDLKTRKVPTSPSRVNGGGVHLGRTMLNEAN